MSAPDFSKARWRKSTRSNGEQACVEVANLSTMTGVRDSKNPAGGVLALGPAAWQALRSAVRCGELD